MGVPGFFRELVKLFPSIIQNSTGKNISHLFLDANCLYHPQCFKILALHIDERDPIKLRTKMIDRILAFIDYLANFINPTELFYVATDGVAPLAKINQQRQRRFGYANDYKTLIYKRHKIPNNDSWSNIVITPGTEFMCELDRRIRNHFTKNIKQSESTYDIVYSSYMTPGEGEHKILQYIKKNCSQKSNSARVIYGLDADLIFLAMASQYDNLYLLREADQLNQARADHDDPTNVGEELLFVDIDQTKESINIQFNNEYLKFIDTEDALLSDDECDNDCDDKQKRDTSFDFCNDYIFICYFLGNDFLPHLPSVDIKISGMDMVIDSYMSVVEKLATTMVKYDLNGNVLIDSDFLYYFICSLAAKEDNFFQSTQPEHLRRMRNRRCYESEQHKRDVWNVENLRSQIDGRGTLSKLIIKDPVKLGKGDSSDWKYRYYEHYFHADYRQSDTIDQICENYIEGLYWVAKYYFEECPTWRWQYRYSHAPFLSDIMFYLEKKRSNMTDASVNFVRDPPLDMYTQLVSVIPQKYSHILPHELRSLSGKSTSSVIDMYPQSYPIDMINKTMLYKCVPHIPYLNVERIEFAVSQCILTKDEIARARKSDVFAFKRKSN
jgi:5'-3' exonuclease